MLLSEGNLKLNNQLTSTPAILATNLSKSVGEGESTIEILRDLNLEVTQGESVAIVGSSGSGKSTLLALLAGLDKPTSGFVTVEGAPLADCAGKSKGVGVTMFLSPRGRG